MAEQVTFYEAVGGEETFHRLVHRFYRASRKTPTFAPCTPRRTSAPPRSGCGCS